MAPRRSTLALAALLLGAMPAGASADGFAVIDGGGILTPRTGDVPLPSPASAADQSVYVISGEGVRIYSLSDYLAGRASPAKSAKAEPAVARVATPRTVVVEPVPSPVPTRAPKPAMLVSPPRLLTQGPTPSAWAPVQTAAGEPAGRDGLGGFLSEVRIGAMAHDVGVFGNNKESGADINAEAQFVSPAFLDIILAPRPHLGASINTAGNTSQVYGGLTWEWNFWGPFFVDGALALAYHNGELDTTAPDRKSLGCEVLFRESVSLGARFLEHHSLSLMLDHISNADICSDNEGLDSLGVRYGYKF